MDQHSKAELIKSYRKRYRKARKKDKSCIISQIVDATGYSRDHAIRALNSSRDIPKRVTRTRKSKYSSISETLKKIWAVANFICGKRLAPFMPLLIASLRLHGEIDLTSKEESLLLSISPATIDRILTPARKAIGIKGRSTTKPGTLLKHQIAVKTFAEWDDTLPGFLQVDLVAHCGISTGGEYINTLNMVDVATGWCVATAFMGRSDRFCSAAIDEVTPSLPFPVLGITSDNGSEFINAHMTRYCERHFITFTRGRAYKKNDSCFIEQKNWDIVRKMIGYKRLETLEELTVLKRIYLLLGFYQNYFQPSRKLISKTWTGAKVYKKYDVARTPAERLLARTDVSEKTKRKLEEIFNNLNPAQLMRDIQKLITDLYELNPHRHLS
jgi:hypothetical protein